MATNTEYAALPLAGPRLFKPRAGFLGGLAIVRVTERFMDVAFAEVVDNSGDLRFTGAFGKELPA